MNILLAIDESEGAAKATDFVRNLAERLQGARVNIVHVVKPIDYRYVTLETGGPNWQKVIEEIEAGARKRARELLDKVEKAFPKAVQTTVLVTVGDPAAEIVNVARETGAEMIVVGSRGLGRMQGMLLGSVSDRIVHLAHCPVLVVR